MASDIDIIRAAFSHISQLEMIYDNAVPDKALKKGFVFEGEVISLRGPQGIFKAQQMENVTLSIMTRISRDGAKPIYIDKETDDGFYQYSFEESKNNRNRYLYASYSQTTPFVYFKAIKPAIYQCIWPCFVASINESKRYFEIQVGRKPRFLEAITITDYEKPKELEARYLVRETKVRGHQAAFREIVLDAYRSRCAITGLPEKKLLEAAHIIPDSDELSTQCVSNGIALNRLHHRAYDADLIGIDPEYRIHIGTALTSIKDGPLLENGILSFDGHKLNLPRNKNSWPDVDYLNRRFENFTIVNSK